VKADLIVFHDLMETADITCCDVMITVCTGSRLPHTFELRIVTVGLEMEEKEVIATHNCIRVDPHENLSITSFFVVSDILVNRRFSSPMG